MEEQVKAVPLSEVDDPVVEEKQPEAPKKEPAKVVESVLGIDFGSSKVSVAVCAGKNYEIVRNELANRTTPCVIVFGSGNRLVGEPAELVKTRGGAITNVKNLLVKAQNVEVQFNGAATSLRPEHVASMLLSRVHGDVQRYTTNNNLKIAPKKTVLTVPCSFSPSQCKALHTAATLAGFEVIGTAFDVSCVSLAFAVREKEAQTVCVVDVGNDFTSAQIFSVDPNASTISLLATASQSASCGASAFSSVLVEMWTKVLADKHKVDLSKLKPEQRDRALMRLNASADKAKTALSGLPETEVVCDSVVPDLDLRVKVSRAEMESRAERVTESLKSLLMEVLETANLTPDLVKRVELVGGGSRIPAVQNVVKSVFGSVSKTLDNECTVAAGAALYASVLDNSFPFVISGTPFGPSFDDAVGLSEDAVKEIEELEKLMRERDLAETAKNDAKNKLEQYVFEIRREASDSENAGRIDDDETLDKLRALLSDAENWTYEEGEHADAAAISAKLGSVQESAKALAPKLFEHLAKKEEKQRQERIASLQEVIAPTEKKSKAHLRPSEKIANALSKKEHGNQLIRDNNYEDATRRYTQALGICGEMDGTLSPADQAQVNEIKLSCYLNLSLANVKLKSAKLGVYNATKAIEMAPDKFKGYFRRAQAHFENKDFEEAKKDLQTAIKLESTDEASKKLLAKVEQHLAAQLEKQKKTFAKMFK